MKYAGIFIILKGDEPQKCLNELRERLIDKGWNFNDWLNFWKKENAGKYRVTDGLSLIRLNNRKWIFGYIHKLKKNEDNLHLRFTEEDIEWLKITANDFFNINATELCSGLIDMEKKFKNKADILKIYNVNDISKIKHIRDYNWYVKQGNDMSSPEMKKIIEEEGLAQI